MLEKKSVHTTYASVAFVISVVNIFIIFPDLTEEVTRANEDETTACPQDLGSTKEFRL